MTPTETNFLGHSSKGRQQKPAETGLSRNASETARSDISGISSQSAGRTSKRYTQHNNWLGAQRDSTTRTSQQHQNSDNQLKTFLNNSTKSRAQNLPNTSQNSTKYASIPLTKSSHSLATTTNNSMMLRHSMKKKKEEKVIKKNYSGTFGAIKGTDINQSSSNNLLSETQDKVRWHPSNTSNSSSTAI